MRMLTCWMILVMLIPLGVFSGCGGTEDGPKIQVDLNIRALCNYGIAPLKEELRCTGELEDECPDLDTGQPRYCWTDPPEPLSKGYCRECVDDAGCSNINHKCDHRFCRLPCTSSADCDATELCTANFCRKPNEADFAFDNVGNKDLEIYVNQTVLIGNQDQDSACAFSRLQWSSGDQETVTIHPDEAGLFLKVRFTPPDVGPYRALIEIHSNSIEYEVLPLLLCGQAVEAVCQTDVDETCPECASCTEEDFKPLFDNRPQPDCSAFD